MPSDKVTPGQILMERTIHGSDWRYQSEETREKWERLAKDVVGSIADDLRREQRRCANLESEIARLQEQVAGLARPSDRRLCGSCRQTRCMAQKERQYGKTCWMYSPNTNRDVQELQDEISRLKVQLSQVQAEQVLVPELKDSDPEWQDVAFRADGHYSGEIGNAFRDGYTIAASRAHSVPASRVLKDGEMPIKISEWERIQAAIAKLKEQHDPVKMAERIQQIADEHKAAHQPQKGPPFEPVSILRDGWTTTHGTAQDSDLRTQGKDTP